MRHKKPAYRIVCQPSWQVQMLHARNGWVTVAFCGSEESAKKALAKRLAFKEYKPSDILRG